MRRVKVTVRSRPISGDRRTLYLDYYPAVRIPETMKNDAAGNIGHVPV